MQVEQITQNEDWQEFLQSQTYTPFLQSTAMQTVYEHTNQHCARFAVRENGIIKAICMVIHVPARRGPHLSIPYGPMLKTSNTVEQNKECIKLLLQAITQHALQKKCWFIRLSPHWPQADQTLLPANAIPAPLHLLAEHIWYLPLRQDCRWGTTPAPVTKDSLFMNLRKTTRNLVRRAQKDGVTIKQSSGLGEDFTQFLRLHEQTRKRHHFTPYTDAFFTAEVAAFSAINECTVYTAWYENECISASIHIHSRGETSYHHGASSSTHSKIPASYLLQWQAISDAFDRGDHVYNFWGIAPITQTDDGKWRIDAAYANHPFAGVTLFKTGFGGNLLELVPCHDIPLNKKYYATRWFEQLRKWKRGF